MKLSIKMRVTLWYAILLVALLVVVLWLMESVSGSYTRTITRRDLEQTVRLAADEVEWEHGELDIDDDLHFYQDGVYLSVYSDDGKHLAGLLPPAFTNAPPLTDDTVQPLTLNGEDYQVYDCRITFKRHPALWLRGVVSVSATHGAMHSMVVLALILLPLWILLALIGGYFITKHAFRPIVQITNTVNAINEGKDLSRRINMGSGKDEITQLANTFDHMLDRLEQSFEAERRFTADASHELRTPTSVIIAECDYALEQEALPQEARESFDVIARQSKRMSLLIAQLLTLARIDRGAVHVEKEPVNLSELIDMVALEQERVANKRQIKIECDVDENIIVTADQTLMMRLFLNLISNAIAYGKEGGWIRIRLYSQGDCAICTVADNGIGIAEENLPKIWDRFFQVNDVRSSDKKSLGLGLAMVKWIVEAHHGTIQVESTLGEGTIFTVTLRKK